MPACRTCGSSPSTPRASPARRCANAERTVLSHDGDQLYVEALAADRNDPVTLSVITTSTGELVRKITDVTDGGKAGLAFPTLILDNAGQHMLVYGGDTGPGFANVRELDLASGESTTVKVTDPEFQGNVNALSW